MPPPPTSRISGLAIAGFVCSVTLCFPFLGLLGAVLSFAALFTTGRPDVRGRGLAVAGLIIGIWRRVGVAVPVGLNMMFKEVDGPVNSFVSDYNKGSDRVIYDQSDPEFKASTSYEKTHEMLDAVRDQWGTAERLGLMDTLSSGGFHVEIENDQMKAHLPLRFAKVWAEGR